MKSEGLPPRLKYPGHEVKASQYLVARLFTDAVFNDDIRAIQLIINRIDGGLPKDTEMADYQTSFGDCIQKVLDMDSLDQMKVTPDTTVMMALCKALFVMATKDIYVNEKGIPRKPTSEQKQERDAAMRLILDRAGGRKTSIKAKVEEVEIEQADWIVASLPGSIEE